MRLENPAVSRPHYYDRNAAGVTLSYGTFGVSPHGNTERIAYTVPSGKKALAGAVILAAEQDTAASAGALATVYLTIGGTTFAGATTYDTAVSTRDRVQIADLGVLVAGTALSVRSQDGKTGGSMHIEAAIRLTIFDA